MSKEFDPAAYDKDKHYAIEASAGTGKTYNIVKIVRKLICEDVGLDRILIVTYTEKAAGELKQRIRKELTKACEEEAGKKKELLEKSLALMDTGNTSIGTIHSFCKNAIEEYSIASGLPSRLKLIDSSRMEDFVRRYLRKSKDIVQELYDVCEGDGGFVETIENNIVSLMKCYYMNEAYKEVPSIVQIFVLDRFNAGLCEIDEVKAYAEKYIQMLETSQSENARKFAADTRKSENLQVRCDAKKFRETLDPEDQVAFDRIIQCRESLKRRVKGNKNPNKGTETFNTFIIKYAGDIYREWQEEKAKNLEQTFDDMLRNVREEVANERPLLGRLRDRYDYAIIDEFQDTNQIQWDIFKRVFLNKNHHIVVVGDPKQSIYAFQGADLSVYKKAVEEIEDCGGNKEVLNTNYRATKDIVDSTAIFFENKDAISEEFEGSGCGRLELKFTYDGERENAFWIADSLISDNGTQEEERKEGEEATVNQEAEDGTSLQVKRYTQLVCQTIVDCCAEGKNGETRLRLTKEDGKEYNVKFSDFTILGRTHSELEPFKKALEKSGIPYMKYKDETLFAGKECADWIAILEAIQAPDFTGRNRHYLRRALFTGFFGNSLMELRNPKFDKDNIGEVILFEKWRRRAGDEKWDLLMEGIFKDTELEKRLTSLKDLKALGAYRQLADYCIDYLSEGHSLDMLIKNLRCQGSSFESDSEQENAGLIGKSTDFDCVRLMTIHASKGLEFPVVISAAGWKGIYSKVDVYGFHDTQGKDNTHYVSLIKTDEYSKEQCREWQRLFYVAYTRAKYILMLPYFSPIKEREFISKSIKAYMKDKRQYKALSLNSAKTWNDLKKEVKKILGENAVAGAEKERQEQEEQLKKMIAEKGKHISRKYAYSSMSHSHGKKEESDEKTDEVMTETGVCVDNEEEPVEEARNAKPDLSCFDRYAKPVACRFDSEVNPLALSSDYPAGADLGNALHDIFEQADYGNWTEGIDGIISNSFEEWGIRENTAWINDTKNMVDNVLGAALPEIRGGSSKDVEFSLGEIERKNRKNEVEFNFNKENEWLKNYFNGFIDLIIRRGEYYSVLDWKSDRLSEDFLSYSDAGELKKHVDETYSIQRVLYSYTLIKWLRNFYPELSEQAIFENHFGGIYYVFLRGCNKGCGNGIYAQTWENFDALKAAFEEIVREKVRED